MSVQAQVVNLLEDLKRDLDLTLVVIAHDLAVIRHMSDRVAVMYLGQIVESGPTDTVFSQARHPYTLALLSAIPEPEHGRTRTRIALSGEPPSPSDPPPGCRFHTRCAFARDECRVRSPELRAARDGHLVACHFWQDIAAAGEGFTPDPVAPASTQRGATFRPLPRRFP